MLIALVVLFIFAFAGEAIFSFMRISMYSFMIAGGIFLFIIAVQMLFGSRVRASKEEQKSAMDKENLTVTPLAIPLLTGPGAITTAMVVFSQANSLDSQLLFIVAVIAAFILASAILVEGRRFAKLLGTTGSKTITRIMGLLLAAVAVEFILNGLSQAAVALF